MVEIVSAPFDLGGKKFGSRLGPAAIRLAGLAETIAGLGYEVVDRGDVALGSPQEEKGKLRGLSEILPLLGSLQLEIEAILERDSLPLVLCGEHTLAMGGISAALNLFAPDLFVLWIDAHADIHTPETSLTGNIHGMPLAALQGITDPNSAEWNSLIERLGPVHLSGDRIAWFGLRDVDEPEKPRVRTGHAVTMHEIDRFGVEKTVLGLDRYLREHECRHLWISFDVDVLDPSLAPGTGTAVRGGLTYREAHLLAELLREISTSAGCPYMIAGLDVVEVNPLADTNNQTAALATEWVASLLGKTIL